MQRLGLTACGAMQINKLDWVVWMTSFLGTVFLGVEVGLSLSIGLALMLVIYESAFPPVPILGRLPESTIYRCSSRSPHCDSWRRLS